MINIAELFVFGQLELVNTGELLKPVGLLEIFCHHFEMGFVDFFPVNLWFSMSLEQFDLITKEGEETHKKVIELINQNIRFATWT